MTEPIGQRTDGADRDALAAQIGDRLDRRIRFYRERDIGWGAGGRGDGEDRRALGRECHRRAAAETDIDAVRRHPFLQLGVAAKARDRDVDTVFGEDALLRANIERDEAELPGHRFGGTDLNRGLRRRCR